MGSVRGDRLPLTKKWKERKVELFTRRVYICGFGKVYISNSDFEKLKNKKIGEVNDAIVYNAGKGLLYKVYKNESMSEYIKVKRKI